MSALSISYPFGTIRLTDWESGLENVTYGLPCSPVSRPAGNTAAPALRSPSRGGLLERRHLRLITTLNTAEDQAISGLEQADEVMMSDGLRSIPVIHYVENQLSRASTAVLGSDGIDAETRLQVLALLAQVCDLTTTFPSVLPDEDDTAMLEWAAEPFMLAVQVDHTGPVHVLSRTKTTSESSEQPDRIRTIMRSRLAAIAAHVQAVNPAWRAAYKTQ